MPLKKKMLRDLPTPACTKWHHRFFAKRNRPTRVVKKAHLHRQGRARATLAVRREVDADRLGVGEAGVLEGVHVREVVRLAREHNLSRPVRFEEGWVEERGYVIKYSCAPPAT